MLRLAVVGVMCSLVGCATTPTASTTVMKPVAGTPAATGSVALHVKGMGCPLCATNVRKSLERTPGVESVDIDLGTGVVRVSARPNAALEVGTLRKAVADASFDCSKVERL